MKQVIVTVVIILTVAGALVWSFVAYPLEQTETVYIHVSYNNLTGDKAKYTEVDGQGIASYWLSGWTRTSSDRLYICKVRQEYWERVAENSFVRIPMEKCREVEP